MLDVLKFPIVDPDDLLGRVVPMYRGFGCWRVRGIFCIRCHVQGQI